MFARAVENKPGDNILEHRIARDLDAIDKPVDLFRGKEAFLFIAPLKKRGARYVILVDAGSLPLKRQIIDVAHKDNYPVNSARLMRRTPRVNKIGKIAFGQFVKVIVAKKRKHVIIQ